MVSNSNTVFITQEPIGSLEINRNYILAVGSVFIAILLFAIVRELLTHKRTTSRKTKISIWMCKEMDTFDISGEDFQGVDIDDFARNNSSPEQNPSYESVYHDVNEFSETRHLPESLHPPRVFENEIKTLMLEAISATSDG